MEMTNRSETSFRLGERWRVDPHLHRLTGPAAAVQVEPKVMGVLVELAREPGRVRSQEELREAVWGTPHVGPGHDSVLYLKPDGDGEPEQVAVLEDWPMNPSLALAPDAAWLIYSQAHGVESDLVLVEGPL